jgi:hypothetical protein
VTQANAVQHVRFFGFMGLIYRIRRDALKRKSYRLMAVTGQHKDKENLGNPLDRNISGCFALLLPLDFRLVNKVKKNMSLHRVHNTINITLSPN